MVLKQDYATSEIRSLTNEKLNLLAIKHAHAQFSTVKGFATTALLGLVSMTSTLWWLMLAGVCNILLCNRVGY